MALCERFALLILKNLRHSRYQYVIGKLSAG